MVPPEDTLHVSRVHKCVLKLVNSLVQNLQKPYMFDLGRHCPLICDALWSICHKGGLWAPLKNCFVVLHPCDLQQLIAFWFTRYFPGVALPLNVKLVTEIDIQDNL